MAEQVDSAPPEIDHTRIREFLKQYNEQHPLNADSDEEQTRQQANQSPPPNCSICLGRVKSKCFTDSCMHQFCFNCLLEWSKIKPECPLCKQTFKSIIHNVTSMDKYDKYKVGNPHHNQVDWYSIHNDMNLLFASLPATFQPFDRPFERFRSRTEEILRQRLYQLFRRETPMTLRFGELYATEVFPLRVNGIQWRNYVYLRALYADPLSDLNGQFRDISASFFRLNPAQMHRLTPWLHRELVCVCVESVHPISYMTQSILQLLKTYDLASDNFRGNIRTYISANTDHFIHELTNYARSPFDMVGYDRHVTYSPRIPHGLDVVSLTSSSSETDSSDVEFVPNAARAPSRAVAENLSTSKSDETSPSTSIDQNAPSTSGLSTVRSHHTTSASNENDSFNSSDSDGEEIRSYLNCGPSASAEEMIRGRTGSTPPRIEANPNCVDGSGQTVIVAPTAQMASTSQAVQSTTDQAVGNIKCENTDSDTDECLFVCAKKPPHLRTPEYVELLNSDSDSDVVFVSSEKMPTLNLIESDESRAKTGEPSTSAPATVIKATKSTPIKSTPTKPKSKKRKRAASKATVKRCRSSTAVEPSSTQVQWFIPTRSTRRTRQTQADDENVPSTAVNALPLKKRQTSQKRITPIKLSRRKRAHEPAPNESSMSESDSDCRSASRASSDSDSSNKESSHEEYGDAATAAVTRARNGAKRTKVQVKRRDRKRYHSSDRPSTSQQTVDESSDEKSESSANRTSSNDDSESGSADDS